VAILLSGCSDKEIQNLQHQKEELKGGIASLEQKLAESDKEREQLKSGEWAKVTTQLELEAQRLKAEAENFRIKKVNLAEKLQGNSVFKIEANEINVNEDLIKRVEFGKNTAIITYFNKTGESLRPKYAFHVFNDYGFKIGSFSAKWLLDTVFAGDTEKENKSFGIYKLDEFFQYSDFKLPGDWNEPIYILIEGEAE